MKKTSLLAIALSTGVFAASFSNVVSAADPADYHYGFSFKIYSWGQNNKEPDGRERSTSNWMNAWKVRLISSTEGAGTVSEFWMTNSSGVQSTPSLNKKQGSGYTYKYAYSDANQRTNWLTAQNNNFNSTTYTVSGGWDEETGVLVDSNN